MHAASQEPLRITAKLNGRYHSPGEVLALVQSVDAEFRSSLPTVSRGGLLQTTELNLTRNTFRYEIE
jgi:hypothetical protein